MSITPPATSGELVGLLEDFRCIDDQELIDELLARTRARRAAEAEEAALLTALAARAEAAHGGIVGAGVEEIGWLLGVSGRSADHLVDTSTEVTARPLVWDAWHLGLIDRAKAAKIVTMLADVPDPQREQLEARAIGFAVEHTPAQLHRHLLALTCDNDPDETMRKEAIDRRGVWVTPAAHGMAWISIYTCAEGADAFLRSLDQLADSADCADPYEQGAARTRDQRRADALAGFLDDHTVRNIDVQVIIPADMLMGVETAGAQINGSPATRAIALHLAWSPDARWMRLVTDPLTGVLLDAGTRSYEIPERLRKAVRMRDRTCRFPGCTRPAEYTDTDHVRPWPQGKTRSENLVCLCRHHHRAKTFGRWRITTASTYAAETTWHGPLGTVRTTKPSPHRRT